VEDETLEKAAKPANPTQMLYAKKIAGERHGRSRGGQGELGRHVRLDRLELKREAPQARSQDRLQAGGISCADNELRG
jgi:hypothetical protein